MNFEFCFFSNTYYSRFNQLEKKLDEAESLIDSLHRKVNELQRFESIARTQQDCELVLASTREKHEQEIINLNEKLHNGKSIS